MDAREKQDLLENLASGREALLAALGDINLGKIDEDLAARTPEPGRWSVRECVEHLVLAEEHMFAQILSSRPAETPVGSRVRENGIRKRGADRSSPSKAPETAQPTGRFATLAEALATFIDRHDRTIDYVRQLNDDPRQRTANHPLIGPVNCYELLLIIAVHPHRHAAQVREALQAISAER